MIQHIIPQSVPGNRIVDIIALESVPVVCQFFRAKDQYTLVAFFIIFYDIGSVIMFGKIITAVVTPFDEFKNIDYENFKKILIDTRSKAKKMSVVK